MSKRWSDHVIVEPSVTARSWRDPLNPTVSPGPNPGPTMYATGAGQSGVRVLHCTVMNCPYWTGDGAEMVPLAVIVQNRPGSSA